MVNATFPRNASLGAAYQVCRPDAFKVVTEVMMLAYRRPGGVGRGEQAGLLREVAGNPFRPVAADPRWRTRTVTGLASAIHADRAFDRLPVLADVLEEAGCNHPDVLAHLRSDGPHVKGCRALDLVLGKSCIS